MLSDDCDLRVVTVLRRTPRAVCSRLAAYKGSKPLGASPTMEEPIAWRATADRFDDGSLFPGSFVALDMVKHSGIKKIHVAVRWYS